MVSMCGVSQWVYKCTGALQSGEIEIDFSLGARVQCMFSQATLLVAGLSNGYIYLLNLQVSRMYCTCSSF